MVSREPGGGRSGPAADRSRRRRGRIDCVRNPGALCRTPSQGDPRPMKIRTQLVAAFFVLAILPLSAIVLFSYVTSLRAVRSAMEEETRALTEEMDGRMASIRDDLVKSFASLGSSRSGACPVTSTRRGHPTAARRVDPGDGRQRAGGPVAGVRAGGPAAGAGHGGDGCVAGVAEVSAAGPVAAPAASQGAVVIDVPRVLKSSRPPGGRRRRRGRSRRRGGGGRPRRRGPGRARRQPRRRAALARGELRRAEEAQEPVPEAARQEMESSLGPSARRARWSPRGSTRRSRPGAS